MYYLNDVIYRISRKSLESGGFHSGVTVLLGYTVCCNTGKADCDGICLVVWGWNFIIHCKFKGEGWWGVRTNKSLQTASWVSWMLFWLLELFLVLSILLGGNLDNDQKLGMENMLVIKFGWDLTSPLTGKSPSIAQDASTDPLRQNFGTMAIAPKIFRSAQHQYRKFPSTMPNAVSDSHTDVLNSFENQNILLTFFAGWITFWPLLYWPFWASSTHLHSTSSKIFSTTIQFHWTCAEIFSAIIHLRWTHTESFCAKADLCWTCWKHVFFSSWDLTLLHITSSNLSLP